MNIPRKVIALIILVILAYGAYQLSQRPASIPDAPVVVPAVPSQSPAVPEMAVPPTTSNAPPAAPSGASSGEVAPPQPTREGEGKIDEQKKKELLKKQSVFK